jgi:hypothetical protein
VLTCWPPGPDERQNRQPSSDEGIVSAGDTSRSIQPALHNMGAIAFSPARLWKRCAGRHIISILMIKARESARREH